MHSLGCIVCGQVGGPQNSPGTPRQPSDFEPDCTVSKGSAVDNCWPSGRTLTYRDLAPDSTLPSGLFAQRTRLLPDEKTRRPTRLSGHFRNANAGTCNRRVESDASHADNPARRMARLAGIEPATLSLGGGSSKFHFSQLNQLLRFCCCAQTVPMGQFWDSRQQGRAGYGNGHEANRQDW